MDITGITSKEAFEMGLACGPLGTGNVDVGILDTKSLYEEYITFSSQTVESPMFSTFKIGERTDTNGNTTDILSSPVINCKLYMKFLKDCLVAAGIDENTITEHLKAPLGNQAPEIGVYFETKNNKFKVIAGSLCAQTYGVFGDIDLRLERLLWVSGTTNLWGETNRIFWVQPDGKEFELSGGGLIPCTTKQEGGYYICTIYKPGCDINNNGIVYLNTSFTKTLIDISNTFIFSNYNNSFYRRYNYPGYILPIVGKVEITYSFPSTTSKNMLVLFNQREYSAEILKNMGVEPILAPDRVKEAFYSCIHTTENKEYVPVKVTDLHDTDKYFYGLHYITANSIRPVFIVLEKGTMLGIYDN